MSDYAMDSEKCHYLLAGVEYCVFTMHGAMILRLKLAFMAFDGRRSRIEIATHGKEEGSRISSLASSVGPCIGTQESRPIPLSMQRLCPWVMII
jgi:hypothetical protein